MTIKTIGQRFRKRLLTLAIKQLEIQSVNTVVAENVYMNEHKRWQTNKQINIKFFFVSRRAMRVTTKKQ